MIVSAVAEAVVGVRNIIADWRSVVVVVVVGDGGWLSSDGSSRWDNFSADWRDVRDGGDASSDGYSRYRNITADCRSVVFGGGDGSGGVWGGGGGGDFAVINSMMFITV